MSPALDDPEVRAVLSASGWAAGRRADLSSAIELLEGEGHRFSEVARELLADLGGLVIRPASVRRPLADPFDVDPLGAASGEIDRIRLAEAVIGRDLGPLGEAGTDIVAVTAAGTLVLIGVTDVQPLGDGLTTGIRYLLGLDAEPPRPPSIRLG